MSLAPKKLKLLRKIYRKIPKLFEKLVGLSIKKVYNDGFFFRPIDGPFGGKRPCDHLVISKYYVAGFEEKTKTFERFEDAVWNPNEVKPHQLYCLSALESLGMPSRIILGWYKLDFPHFKLIHIDTISPHEIAELQTKRELIYLKSKSITK